MPQYMPKSLFEKVWKMFESDHYRIATATPTEYDFTKWWKDNNLAIPMRLIEYGRK